MDKTAVGEPASTTIAAVGAEPGGSGPRPTDASSCQQPDTLGSGVQEDGEGPANVSGESLPQPATQGPGENGSGPSSDDAGSVATTSPSSNVADCAAVPADKDAAGVVGGGGGGKDEDKNIVGVEQLRHGDEGKSGVGAVVPASAAQEDGQSKDKPVRVTLVGRCNIQGLRCGRS